jgi:hypothetical protein
MQSERIHPFAFAENSVDSIIAALDATHVVGKRFSRCGRFSRDGTHIFSCEQCASFTLQWMVDAEAHPMLRDVLPRQAP